MRWTLALIASALLLAGCTPQPQPAAETDLVPHELIQQYTRSCTGPIENATGTFAYSIGSGPASVIAEIDTPENRAAVAAVLECLNRYRYEEESPLQFVTAYERAELYDYYIGSTVPCLAEHGVTAPSVPRAQFFFSDRRYWNPYPEMDDIPFDELLTLYRACPPVPEYVLSRHVTYQAG
ncbi:MAG TPA: hypothetical protein VHK64_00940 [Nocardioidaceae bacterium]|nr:hypothetical protein [Nocardioidaceae bacterium]